MNKIIYLWAVPRSVSTAFERIFYERKDFEVFHEPYSEAYYFSNERQSDRYIQCLKKKIHKNNYKSIRTKIDDKQMLIKHTIFIKDMAFHVKNKYQQTIDLNAKHAFIIRKPINALSSQYKLLKDFNEIEAGYTELYTLYNYISENSTHKPFLFDGDNLQKNPKITYSNFCKYMDLPFSKKDLNWNKRKIKEWGIWENWHKDASNSTKITYSHKKDINLPSKFDSILCKANKIYEELICKIN